MLVRLSSADPTPAGGGWGRLLLETLSRGYLAGLLTLVACAVLPTVLGWQASVIVSGSMEPHIDVGDVVLTTGLKTDAPVPVGRVVTFTRPAAASASGRETIVMHRIVSAKDNETYVTAGDANADVDSTTIVREQITGQGRLLVPWVGLPARWAATGETVKLGAWILLTLAALLVVASSIPRRRREPTDPPAPRTRGPGPGTRTPLPELPSRHQGIVQRPGHHRKHATKTPAGAGVRRGILTFTAISGLILTAAALLPVGEADAAFSARTTNAGNSFTVAVNASTATSRLQVYDTPGAGGWYQRSSVNGVVTATTNAGSSIKSITYRINGGTPITRTGNTSNFTISTQGTNTITYYATDNQGRKENEHAATIKLDNQPPAVAITSRTGDMTHAQWKAACTANSATGGLCGTVTDTNGSGVATVKYVLRRSSDSRCYNGSAWTTAACNTRTAATTTSNTWFASLPDSKLQVARDYYTATMYAADAAGNEANTTKSFSVG